MRQFDEYPLDNLIEFAKQYRDMGDAVQEQLDDLLVGNFDGINPNAVKVIEEHVAAWHHEIAGAVEEYNEWRKREDEDEDEDE